MVAGVVEKYWGAAGRERGRLTHVASYKQLVHHISGVTYLTLCTSC